MYPTAPDHEKYAGDHDHHHVPGQVPGMSPHGVPRVYAPPYVVSTVRSARRHVGEEWSTGLCHCCDDPANCLITFFCPCITFGQIAEIVDQGSSSCAQQGTCYGILLATTALACLYSCFYRSKLRGQYDLEESPCVDCLVHFCCPTCALCQEYRELKNRGFDMGIGWEANMERRRRAGVTQAPIAAPVRDRRKEQKDAAGGIGSRFVHCFYDILILLISSYAAIGLDIWLICRSLSSILLTISVKLYS